MKNFPTLYKKSSTGKTSEWTICARHTQDGADYNVVHGYVDGKKQSTTVQVDSGKNIGKKNETSAYEQACAEAESKWKKQLDKGYVEDCSSVDSVKAERISPMLAYSYDDHPKKIKWPCYWQPKLDGCVSGDTLIKTKEYGYKSIKWIVDNKINCKVKSRDKNGKLEYKDIIYWFLNKEKTNQWYEIELESGEKLTLTGNHPVYLPDLDCYRRVDELDGSENLMVL